MRGCGDRGWDAVVAGCPNCRTKRVQHASRTAVRLSPGACSGGLQQVGLVNTLSVVTANGTFVANKWYPLRGCNQDLTLPEGRVPQPKIAEQARAACTRITCVSGCTHTRRCRWALPSCVEETGSAAHDARTTSSLFRRCNSSLSG